MSVEQLEKQVIQWATDRCIFSESTHYTRGQKFMEEVEEFVDEAWPEDGKMDMEAVKMECGDVLVTLINLLHPMGLDLETCLAAAYGKIKGRTGRMVDGTFVKDGDL